jgi:hypothetical protein
MFSDLTPAEQLLGLMVTVGIVAWIVWQLLKADGGGGE